MSAADPFNSPEAEIPRDRWGRPLIVPPDGGKPEPYTRATTLAGTLEDTYGLTQWQLRQTVRGMGVSPGLVLAAAAATPDDKRTLGGLAKKAMDAADTNDAAGVGTALHSYMERMDAGCAVEDLGYVPPQYLPDLYAYAELARNEGLKSVSSEGFCVYDAFKVAGSFDNIYEFEGKRYMGDKKTFAKAQNLGYGALKISAQIAIYSRASLYDVAAAQRTPLDVDQDRGLVVHVPAGGGSASLHWVDLRKGWRAVEIAHEVRALRADKSALYPVREAVKAKTLHEQIDAATTTPALLAVYHANKRSWTDAHTAAASARKRVLEHN